MITTTTTTTTTIIGIIGMLGMLIVFSVAIWIINGKNKAIQNLSRQVDSWGAMYYAQVKETERYSDMVVQRNRDVLLLQEQIRNSIKKDESPFSLTELREQVVAILHENGLTGTNSIEISIWDHDHYKKKRLDYSFSVAIFKGETLVKTWRATNPETLLSKMREFFIGYNAQNTEVKDIIINNQKETDGNII